MCSLEQSAGKVCREKAGIVLVLSRPHIKGIPLPPAQALCILYQGKRKMHLTDDEVQYTMERTNKKGEATSCPFSPSHLPLHTNFQWERGDRVWGRGYPVLADIKVYNSYTSFPYFLYIKPVFSRHTNTRVGLGGSLQSRGFTASLDHSGLSITDSRCSSYYLFCVCVS